MLKDILLGIGIAWCVALVFSALYLGYYYLPAPWSDVSAAFLVLGIMGGFAGLRVWVVSR